MSTRQGSSATHTDPEHPVTEEGNVGMMFMLGHYIVEHPYYCYSHPYFSVSLQYIYIYIFFLFILGGGGFYFLPQFLCSFYFL